MLLHIVLGGLYYILFCFFITKSSFVKKTDIATHWVILFFTIKVLAGFTYGYIHAAIKDGASSDTWKFYIQSLPETELLFKNPILFLKSIFGNGYQDDSGFLITTNSYWNDLKHNIMLFFMSICNIFSKSNYYINSLFYNAATFFGLVAFYRVVLHYGTLPAKLLQFILFLLPSFVFWTSGFHKEGIIFSCLSFLLFSTIQLLQGKKIVFHFSKFVICILLIAFLRSYLLLFFMPFFLVFLINSALAPQKQSLLYAISILTFVVTFVFIGNVSDTFNMLKYVAQAHNDFVLLPANSKINTEQLTPTIAAMKDYFGTAIVTGFVEPVSYWKSLLILPALFDNFLILAMLFLLLLYKKYVQYSNNALFFIIISVFIFLFLGYTVPIIGAIIRYKAVVLPFMLCGLAGLINWEKLIANKPKLKFLQS